MKYVPILDSFKFAFGMIKINLNILLTLALMNLILGIIHLLVNDIWISPMAERMDFSINGLWLIIYYVIFAILGTILQILYIKVGFKVYESRETISFKDISLPSASLVGRFILVIIVYALLISLGLWLLLIPGFVIALAYIFCEYVLVDYDLPAKKVFRISEKLTEGIKWKLVGYVFIISLLVLPFIAVSFWNAFTLQLNYVQYLVLTVATLVGLISSLSWVYIYKDIQRQQNLLDQAPVLEDSASA